MFYNFLEDVQNKTTLASLFKKSNTSMRVTLILVRLLKCVLSATTGLSQIYLIIQSRYNDYKEFFSMEKLNHFTTRKKIECKSLCLKI